jgi:PKD repeat protein
MPSSSLASPRALPTTTTTTTITTTSTLSPPAPVRQVFDSFQIIATPTDPLTLRLTSSDTEGVAPATFRFEAHVTGGTEPYTYSWNFGDGSQQGNEQTVLHTFDRAGTYNVRVIVTDSTARAASDSILVNVQEPPAMEEPM